MSCSSLYKRPEMRRLSRFLAVMMLLAGLLPQLVFARSGESPTAPAHISATLPAAQLIGNGSFTWLGLKIYDAQLWADSKNFNRDVPAQKPFALDLRYARKLQGKKIADASLDEIKNLGIGTAAQHSNWLAAMTTLFPDVEKGWHLTGMHMPGEGARFFLNGTLLGDIADPVFSAAFFAIWLDPKTSAPKLRLALLDGQ